MPWLEKGTALFDLVFVDFPDPNSFAVGKLYTKRFYSLLKKRLAPDGAVALAELTRALPDLVILDLMLPEIDGLELTRRLRAVSNTPIIMLTSRREEIDRVLGLELSLIHISEPTRPY